MIDVINPQLWQATQQCRNRNLALDAGQLGALEDVDEIGGIRLEKGQSVVACSVRPIAILRFIGTPIG